MDIGILSLRDAKKKMKDEVNKSKPYKWNQGTEDAKKILEEEEEQERLRKEAAEKAAKAAAEKAAKE